MASFRHSSLIFVFLFFSAATISLSSEPPNKEVQALIAVRDLLIDPHGALSKWDETSVDPCSWFMITCSSENRVIGLGAPGQSLSGHLSSTIGNLTNLQQILLQNNNIAGKIPSELGLLIKLQTMDLSNNRFSGSIPNSLGRLSNLRYLRLNNNSLSGSFPLTLSKIPQLSFLDFSYNNFSGPVPSIPARTFNVVGNPLICGEQSPSDCYGTITHIPLPLLESNLRERKTQLATVVGTGAGVLTALLLLVALALFIRRRRRFKRRFRSSFNGIMKGLYSSIAHIHSSLSFVQIHSSLMRLKSLQVVRYLLPGLHSRLAPPASPSLYFAAVLLPLCIRCFMYTCGPVK